MVHTLRQGRGYRHEDWLVDEFKKIGWSARRLGGSSTGLPDVVAVNHDTGWPQLLSIECKSGKLIHDGNVGYKKHYLYIEKKQVDRCIMIAKMFDAYHADVMFSFKFSYGTSRPPLIYHFLMDSRCYNVMNRFHSLVCNSAGECIFSYDAGTISDVKSMEINEFEPAGSIILQRYHLNRGIVNVPGATVSAGYDTYTNTNKTAEEEYNVVLGLS